MIFSQNGIFSGVNSLLVSGRKCVQQELWHRCSTFTVTCLVFLGGIGGVTRTMLKYWMNEISDITGNPQKGGELKQEEDFNRDCAQAIAESLDLFDKAWQLRTGLPLP